MFAALPAAMASPTNPITDAKVDLGRTLYHDPRLSKNQDVSSRRRRLPEGWPREALAEPEGSGALRDHEEGRGPDDVQGPRRNVDKTAPYFHDGSGKTLEESVKAMASLQSAKELKDTEVKSIVTFLAALTGDLPADLIKVPELPKSTAKTPKPDPSERPFTARSSPSSSARWTASMTRTTTSASSFSS